MWNKKNVRVVWVAAACLLVVFTYGCGGGTSTPVISVSPASAHVAVNATQEFTATIQNDASNSGVTWSLTRGGSPCSPACGMVAPTSTASGGAATYTPPTSVPVNPTVTLTATSVADTAKSAPATITIAGPLPISVSVSPNSASVVANTGFEFTATVLYDAANAGVTWNLTQSGTPCSPGCGSLTPTTTASGELTTYTAPATVPANPTVTLTATSVTDATKSASATVTVVPPPISVSVSPASVLMGVNATQQFTATVKNDGANRGVTWAPVQNGVPCSPTCGSTAPTSTASAEPTTYTGPSTLPTNPAFAVVATSLSDSSQTGRAAITLTNGTVKLVPASVNFGRVSINTVSSVQITLTNTGTSTLTTTSINLTGSQASLAVFSQTNTCGGAVGAGASCLITVSFKPAAASLYAAKLAITDSSADSPQQVDLQGKGKTPTTAALRSALTASAAVTTPSPTGPSGVGTRVVSVVDASRRDPYVNAATRELLIRFWYPASSADGCKPAEYTSPRVWSYFSELIGVRLPIVTTNSCLEAPVADGQHPIVVFTHGYTGTFTDYTFLFEDLASRGYVVVSVDHTYEATAVEFPDGRFVESIPGSHFGQMRGNDASELAFAVSVRLDDLKFVVNELKRLNEAPVSPFAGKLEISRIALAGHSLGGVTALLGVEADPRIKAGIILDGVVPETPARPPTAPIMFLAAGREQWSEAEQHVWDTLRGPRFAVNLRGAEHLTPSDLVWLAGGAIMTGKMGREKTIAAIRDYVAAFLDANLRGQPPDSLLTEPSSRYPDVHLIMPLQSLPGRK
jgi:dienelactone hydrolase